MSTLDKLYKGFRNMAIEAKRSASDANAASSLEKRVKTIALEQRFMDIIVFAQLESSHIDDVGTFLRYNRTVREALIYGTRFKLSEFKRLMQLVFINNPESTIETLSLSNNIAFGDLYVRTLAIILRQNVMNLTTLILSRNQITEEGAMILSTLLGGDTTSLRFLDVSSNKINTKGAVLLLDSLKRNSTLVQLNLADNPYDKTAVQEHYSGMKSRVAAEVIIDAVRDYDDDVVVEQNSESAQQEPMLIDLTTDNDGSSSDNASSATVITSIVVNNQPNVSLTQLRELLNQLIQSDSITTLSLNNCDIDDNGAKLIASMLPLTNIETLSLARNNIKTDGGLALYRMLLRNPKVHTLIISNNFLGGAAVSALALRTKSSLKMLDVSGNPIASDLKNALKSDAKIFV